MKWLIGSAIVVATVGLLPASAPAEPVSSPYKVQGWLKQIEPTPGSDTLWSIKQLGDWEDATYQLVAYRPGAGWTAYDVPAAGRVTDVAMAAETDGWATDSGSGLLQWNGDSWQRAPVAVIGARDTVAQVSAASPADLWVAGGHRVDATTEVPGVWHFDGTSWSRVTVPLGKGDTIDNLLTVGGEVWLSGSSLGGGTATAFALHWDGAEWRSEPLPGAARWTVALAGNSADNVWLVVSDGLNHLVHWDGARWARTARPGEPPYEPVAVDTTSGSDLWSFNSYRFLSRTDGTSWSWDRLHDSCQWDRGYGMGDIEAVAPDDIYIVGACWGWRTYTAVYHFDGEHFTRI